MYPSINFFIIKIKRDKGEIAEMSEKFNEQFDGLLEKYTELLLGESSEERKEQVQKWALYSYIAKTMPALVKHWNETYPDGKEEMVHLIANIKKLNEEHRNHK